MSRRFAELLAHPDVVEESVLRSTFGFMAYHGGRLESMTDTIARTAAEQSGASYYGLLFPDDVPHITSIAFDPDLSPTMTAFLDHVDVVVTIHGYGRDGFWTRLLLGGHHRDLASHLALHLCEALDGYEVLTDLDQMPTQLRGLHARNPVNRPRGGGVQIELPPRVRGQGRHWQEWSGSEPCPDTAALINALTVAAQSWPES
jgi:phage replication-related protein YjqB (UPF0714/DUF867 family)